MTVLDDSSCFGGDEQCFPPGFRFHPTDEELVLYYLKRKICSRRLRLDIIAETDVYKWDPEELPGQSKLKTGDRQWFFFSPRDRKYPNGTRSNRATRHGYWKVTGKDRTITCNSRAVGVKKTLVFYKGRAPTSDRTDWVMHEYTLDEEELKRCQDVQDYYALYKVFKKSGPGPKNGEQYGAPFREEDWADDENTKFIVHAIGENHTKQANDVAAVDNTRTNGQLQSPFNDLEELMNLIANDGVLLQPRTSDDSFALQAIGEEEAQGTLVDQSLLEASLCERSMACHQSGQTNDMQASFNLTQSTTSQLQLHETSEVTCAPNIYIQEPHDAEEDFLEDFLELDDLTDPEPTSQNIEKPAEDLQFEGFDGLSELDLYQDAVMFLQDLGPTANGLDSHSYFSNIANEMVAPVSSSCLNNHENELNPVLHSYVNNFETQMAQSVSHINNSTLDDETGSNLDHPLPPHFNSSSQINCQLWMHDQRCNIVYPAESDRGAMPPPTSGVVYDGSSASFPGGVNQNQNQSGKEDDGRGSWFSSTLWGFVESIPTTPASASEGTALMSRAFERMSSFGRMGNRMRISAGDASVAAVKPPVSLRMPNRRFNKVFWLFSVLGLLCALLWVLTGTSMRILGRCMPS